MLSRLIVYYVAKGLELVLGFALLPPHADTGSGLQVGPLPTVTGTMCWHLPCSTTTVIHNVVIIPESHILYHTTTISNPVWYVNALSPSFNSSLDILILQVSISTRFFSLVVYHFRANDTTPLAECRCVPVKGAILSTIQIEDYYSNVGLEVLLVTGLIQIYYSLVGCG
ncbi:hypothetical protein BBBOND_0308800 [Babesia bigemina]|uniref:Uncharacterized protein n=1 Tax=Babesia bigemina TaxID=5866 RepID=A0A061DAH2_BABBI|nr:hypothetical protein BBBOND_0308800 [Babesia bigemina]CDR96977.1 hypothetical protein BBBOND_0308800 [Babesia bigemina]|eukprot:XP_012769163.1 hypothetical protein BBBOND_0308800 [Babesia bigemina]